MVAATAILHERLIVTLGILMLRWMEPLQTVEVRTHDCER
jgi:hypothetical protein